MRHFNENIATASAILMFGSLPVAVVAELVGYKDLARLSLWAVVVSFIGICIAYLPEAEKEYSIAHMDIKIRELIEHRLSKQYPKYNGDKLVRRGARFMRQNVALPVDSYDGQELCPIDSRYTYMALLFLMEQKAIFLKQSSSGSLRWSINWSGMPKFYRTQTVKRGKCFSCLYWTDPYDEAEELGKDSDELNCAVNPLHQDTQNGCDHHSDDWRKADLSESWAVRS